MLVVTRHLSLFDYYDTAEVSQNSYRQSWRDRVQNNLDVQRDGYPNGSRLQRS